MIQSTPHHDALDVDCAPEPVLGSQAAPGLSTLVEVGRSLNSTLDLEAVLRVICQGSSRLVVDIPTYIVVLLLSHDMETIETVAVSAAGEEQLLTVATPLQGTISAEILASNAPVVTTNYAAACEQRGITPPFPDGQVPFFAWMGVPMMANDRAIGTISIGSCDPGRHFGAAEVDLLSTIASQAATAIENARLYQRTQRQAQHLASLNRISRVITSSLDVERMPQLIIDQAQQLLDAEEGSLLLVDGPDGDLVFAYATGPVGGTLLGQRIPRSSGIAGYVVSTGRSETINNVRDDRRFYQGTDAQTGFTTRSILAVPLRGRTRIEGVIEVINKRSGRPFDDDDQQLIEALADQAVIALENAQRFARVDQDLAHRARELTVSNGQLREILRIGNMLRAERRLDELLTQIVRGVSECTIFPTALIGLARSQGVRRPVIERPISGSGIDHLALQGLGPLPLDEVATLLDPQRRIGDAAYLVPADEPLLRPWQDVHVHNGSPAEHMIFCPLWASDQTLLGMLVVGTPSRQTPSIEHVRSLEIFANQAATVIENARLYDTLQHNLQSLTALNALGIALNSGVRSVEQIVALTASGAMAASGGLGACVLLGERAEALLPAFSTPALLAHGLEPLAARVLAEQRPELLGDQAALPATVLAAGGQSLVTVPLRATRRVLGTMSVVFAEASPAASVQETLVLFANQAAVAIESLELITALHEGRDRLASILASTREGMLMVDQQGQVVEANAALQLLCGLPEPAEGRPLAAFFARWQACGSPDAAEWQAMVAAVTRVREGLAEFANGELTLPGPQPLAVAWSALPVRGQGVSGGGMLLVLRDISAAREAEKLRQDLTNMIIHDLRSPLASVMSSVDMLGRGIIGTLTPTQQRVVSIAYSSGQNMLTMVNTLLDISRLEGGSLPLQRAPLPLALIVASSCENLRQLAQDRKISIDTTIGEDLPEVLADSELIGRVCLNLLDNAIKFSSVGSTITVGATHRDDGWVHLWFRDAGVGIASEHQAKIFEKFGQVGERRGGTGLGLTFCRLVIEAHSGRIWVESTPGKGSTFCIALPSLY